MTASRAIAILAAAAVLTAALPARAQKRFEIGGSYGAQFGGPVHTEEGDVRFANGPNLGFSLAVAVRPNAWVEVSYSRQDTTVDFLPLAGESVPLFDALVEFFQFGGVYEAGGQVSPYALATVGLATMRPGADGTEDEVKFAAALGGGLKIYLARRLGLRLQGRLLFPVLSAGGAFLVGPSGGYVIVTSSVLVWGDLSAGLFFRF